MTELEPWDENEVGGLPPYNFPGAVPRRPAVGIGERLRVERMSAAGDVHTLGRYILAAAVINAVLTCVGLYAIYNVEMYRITKSLERQFEDLSSDLRR